MTPVTTQRPPIAARLCPRSSAAEKQARLNIASAHAPACHSGISVASKSLTSLLRPHQRPPHQARTRSVQPTNLPLATTLSP